jgi:hypothetical protein
MRYRLSPGVAAVSLPCRRAAAEAAVGGSAGPVSVRLFLVKASRLFWIELYFWMPLSSMYIRIRIRSYILHTRQRHGLERDRRAGDGVESESCGLRACFARFRFCSVFVTVLR